jgi:hypothetical protein
VLHTKELAFLGAKNELGFGGKRTQIKAKKVAKTHLLCGIDRMRKNSCDVSFRGAAGDEQSRIVLKTLRARFLAEFTLSGQSEILRFAQNDSEGLRMTAKDSE